MSLINALSALRRFRFHGFMKNEHNILREFTSPKRDCGLFAHPLFRMRAELTYTKTDVINYIYSGLCRRRCFENLRMLSEAV